MDEVCRTYGLQPIRLADKPLFDSFFAALVQPLSDYTFANTFIWHTGERLYQAVIEGHLCVFADGSDDLTMLIPPVGDGDLNRCLRRCFEIMDDYNSSRGGRHHSRIEYVSDEMLARTSGMDLIAMPMSGDYVYETARMIDLAGNALKSKRHARSRFLREHTVWVEALRPDHLAACRALLSFWRDEGADTEDPQLGPAADLIRHRRNLDSLAAEQALGHYTELGLTGMVVWADDRIVGFTLGQRLTARQSSILVEKADRRYVGAAQYIFSEFCRREWSEYPECNVGDDWDIPGLVWTKTSYRPLVRLQKWELRAGSALVPAKFGTDVGSVPVLAGIADMSSVPVLAGIAASTDGAPVRERFATVVDSTPFLAGVRANLESTPCLESPDRHRQGPAIRSATGADASAIATLEQQVFPSEDAFRPKQVRYLLRSPHALALVATEVSNELGLAGWAVVLLRRHATGTSARLYSLAVAPTHRGRGLGGQLVMSALAAIELRGIYRCFLEVRADNLAARRLYERLGFRCLKLLPNYYGEQIHGFSMLRIGEAGQAGQAGESAQAGEADMSIKTMQVSGRPERQARGVRTVGPVV